MLVRAVNIDQRFADFRQNRERGRRAVDELAIRSRSRKCPLQDQLPAHAWFQTMRG